MAIKIQCRECEAKFGVKDAATGRRVKCRQCGAAIKVPRTDEEELLDFDTVAYGDEPSGDDAAIGTRPLPRRRRKNPAANGPLPQAVRNRPGRIVD